MSQSAEGGHRLSVDSSPPGGGSKNPFLDPSQLLGLWGVLTLRPYLLSPSPCLAQRCWSPPDGERVPVFRAHLSVYTGQGPFYPWMESTEHRQGLALEGALSPDQTSHCTVWPSCFQLHRKCYLMNRQEGRNFLFGECNV